MKIGIITFHCADNYGAVLQTFGLYNKLKELYPSSELYLVDYCPGSIKKAYSLINLRNIFSFFSSILRLPLTIKKKSRFNKFRNNNFKFIGHENINCLDYLVCGSDQIWNPRHTGFIDPYYFGYINGFQGKAIAYAASDGGYFEHINDETIRYIVNMSAISVRESAMLPIFEKYKQDIKIVLDPVFLFDNNFWCKCASKIRNKNYILIYRVADDYKIVKDAYSLAKQTDLEIIEIANYYPFRDIFKNLHKMITTSDIPDFLAYILYADYIFTNSFHGTAFSIIFNKNFYSYSLNDKRQNRIHNILSEFHLVNRYGADFNVQKLKNIDYSIVNEIVIQKRNESVSFLTKHIQ